MIRPKYVVYIFEKGKRSEQEPKLHADGKSDIKIEIPIVQQLLQHNTVVKITGIYLPML
jgi:hypothetical protein